MTEDMSCRLDRDAVARYRRAVNHHTLPADLREWATDRLASHKPAGPVFGR